MSLVQVMVAATLLAGLSWVATSVIKQFGEGHKSIELRGIADNIQQRMKAATLSPEALGKSKVLSPALSDCVAKCLAKPDECMSDAKCPSHETPFSLVDAAGEPLVVDPAGYVDDGGHACDQATNKVTCRWRSLATFRPKSSDTVAMSFKIEYAPPPGNQVGAPMKAREWTADIPLSFLAATGGDPLVTKSYVDAAVSSSGGGCFETEASSCGSGYVAQVTQTRYRCVLGGDGGSLILFDSTNPCPSATIPYSVTGGVHHLYPATQLGPTTTRICCPKPAS